MMVTNRYEATSGDVFAKVLGTVVVFFLAHLFATAVSHLSHVENVDAPLSESFRHALVHSVGMLIAAVVPLAIVFLGVVNAISDDIALWTALWVDVGLLGVLGYLSARAWTRRRALRLAVAAGTALLGVCIVVLKALIH